MYLDLTSLLAILALIASAAGAWFWNDSLQARERMTATCTRICGDMSLQFLDETVALARLRLTRTPGGWLAWRRMYVFEFSESGSDRWKGRALLTGQRVESVHLDNPQGVTILSGATPTSGSIIPWGQHSPDVEDKGRLH
ncbi:MAG TPA: DUF3301 domain-containing protein [Gammaproteobacteria bacterium]|nr:DUF3301 domain-containing protein [Gammaproteobacteria bacterium]